jgi:hypothetical protein
MKALTPLLSVLDAARGTRAAAQTYDDVILYFSVEDVHFLRRDSGSAARRAPHDRSRRLIEHGEPKWNRKSRSTGFR